MFDRKIDKFTEFDNMLSELRTDKLEYLKKIDILDEKISNTVEEKRNYGLRYFLDREKRENLLEQAAKYGYSPLKINELQPYIDNWNQDIITNEVVNSFRIVEQFVNDNQEKYKGHFMYKVSKLFQSQGGNENEN